MKIRLYQVKSGDCIYIKFSHRNIVIDAGFFVTAKSSLFHAFEECINLSEKIDLLIITHTDQDHISGMKGLDGKEKYTKILDTVWLNKPDSIKQRNTSPYISFLQGEQIKNLLEANSIPYKTEIHNELNDYNFENAKILILSPKREDLNNYNDKWEKAINDKEVVSYKRDWDRSIDELINEELPKDNSRSNRASIAFILSHGDSKALFLGDAHPDVITEKLQSCGYSSAKPLKLDCVKLSHHGSSYNISDDLLNLIDCPRYLISSNSSYLDKLTLAKIIHFNRKKSDGDVHFYFNFPKEVYRGLITEDEIKKHGIICHFAEAGQNHIELVLE